MNFTFLGLTFPDCVMFFTFSVPVILMALVVLLEQYREALNQKRKL